MKRSRLEKPAQKPARSEVDDLSFPPPYSEQAKYLFLADIFLAMERHRNVVSLDSSRHFKGAKNAKVKRAA